MSRVNGSVKGVWAINPSLFMPASFLPPVKDVDERPNVSLHAVNGSVDAELYIITPSSCSTGFTAPTSGTTTTALGEWRPKSKVGINVTSRNGSITCKIVSTDTAYLAFYVLI